MQQLADEVDPFKDMKCTVDGLKAAAGTAFGLWDLCVTAPDYKAPNADAKRRLLSEGSQETESLKWVWSASQGESSVPTYPHPPSSMMLAAKFSSLSECQTQALKSVCPKITACSSPVCKSYYAEPEIQRLCGICQMGYNTWYWASACFAADAPVSVAGRAAPVRVGDVRVGDMVEAAGPAGERVFSRVYYVHDHPAAAPVLSLAHAQGALELSPTHSLPVYTESCGESYCASARLAMAKDVRVGDRVYVSAPDGFRAQAVRAISSRQSGVRYLLTEAGTVVAGGAVASVVSTAAGPMEVLPFRLLDWAWPGVLQLPPVAAAMAAVLESPALKAAEFAMMRASEAGAGKLDAPPLLDALLLAAPAPLAPLSPLSAAF